ncbi:uncharacterized protein METZ01_LOCUS20485 [marine metagenome]|uniref:Uncharacterized protein n=1 Tax=marine metagenome TaxID=408172 RepID=A0A381PKV7_9ZZZZ
MHTGRALVGHSELCRGSKRKIDDPTLDKGPPIIHTKDHGPTVGQVCDTNVGRKREALVRGSHAIHVVHIPRGRLPSMEVSPIPRCYALLAVSVARLHHSIGDTVDDVRLGIT